jgi:hypothetical protein
MNTKAGRWDQQPGLIYITTVDANGIVDRQAAPGGEPGPLAALTSSTDFGCNSACNRGNHAPGGKACGRVHMVKENRIVQRLIRTAS